jgi:lipopolysaccharide/colanic/teichoic acid biosynthesis glycosyltransferase
MIKRTFDLTVSFAALLFLAPLLLFLATLIAARLGRPVLFRQTRIGLRGRKFDFIKFRTMRDARGPDGRLLPDGERLTGLGDLLRRWSLDELPQLWNVMRGEMSLVGPRPLLPQYLPRYSARQARRHEIKPGITGWAQVNGRNTLSWEEKFELDVWYVEHQSFPLDCRILWMTLVQVLRHQGIAASGHATMPEFMGATGETGRSQ